MAVNITGSAVSPDGSIKAGTRITLRRAILDVVSQGGNFVIPDDIYIKTDSLGQVDFEILPGRYIASAKAVGNLDVSFEFNVADVASADFADCVGAAWVPIPPDSVSQAQTYRDDAEAFAQDAADSATEASGYKDTALTASAQLVYPEQYGAVGDGVADDTGALQDALDFVGGLGGGIVRLSAGKKYLIDSDNIVVPRNVALIGSEWSGGQRQGNDYTVMNGIILNPSYSVHMLRNSRISCVISRKGLDKPDSLRSALIGRNNFTGTAIKIGDVSNTFASGSDVAVFNCFVIGFDVAVSCVNQEKVAIDHLRGDCTNGLHLKNATGTTRISNVHFWDFYTAHNPWQVGSWSVSNVYDNGTGVIRVTSPSHGVETGDIIGITGIVGVPSANGRHIAIKIDEDTIDLDASTFSGLYVSGGTIWINSSAHRGTFIDLEDSDGVVCHGVTCYAYDVGIILNGGSGVLQSFEGTSVNIDANPNYGDSGTIGLKVIGSVYNARITGGYIAGYGNGIEFDTTDIRESSLSGCFIGGSEYAVNLKDGSLTLDNCTTSGVINIMDAATALRVVNCGLAGTSFSYESANAFRKVIMLSNRTPDENLWISNSVVHIATNDVGKTHKMRSRIRVPDTDKIRIGARNSTEGGAILFDTKSESAQYSIGLDGADDNFIIGRVTGDGANVVTIGPVVSHGSVGYHELNLAAKPVTPVVGTFYSIDFETKKSDGASAVYSSITGVAADLTNGAHKGRIDFRVADGGGGVSTAMSINDTKSLVHSSGSTNVINGSGHIGLRSYTLSTLPPASPAAQMIYVTDLTGGAQPCFSNGANWLRCSDRTVAS